MNDTHYSADDYAAFVLGGMESPDKDQMLAHLHGHCEVCRQELREAGGFWYVFAALTERTQDMAFPEPAPMLRDRVLGIARRSRNPLTQMPRVQTWLRIAAGILVIAGAASLAWNVGQYQIKKEISAARARAELESAAVRKLESENNVLRNLVEAARNAPAVFPGRDAIVSVQDPYLVRDLQRARQTLAGVKGLTVTEEQAGGSRQPGGQKILTGTIQSTVR